MKKAKTNKTALLIFLEDKNREQVQSQFSDAIESTDADALYRAFLQDTIVACLNAGSYEVIICYAAGKSKKILDQAINDLIGTLRGKSKDRLEHAEGWLWQQERHNSSRDMQAAVDRCFDMGYRAVVLVDCVTPTISKQMLQNANQVLEQKDIVFGPTLEGSYYLLGMRKKCPQLFDQIDWSENDKVYSKMVEIASSGELDWEELELWYNMRQPGDIEFLARDINAFRLAGDERSARHTEKVLEALLQKFQSEEA
ncbi:MAG: DUF2064 domain-containing protein [bacterium]